MRIFSNFSGLPENRLSNRLHTLSLAWTSDCEIIIKNGCEDVTFRDLCKHAGPSYLTHTLQSLFIYYFNFLDPFPFAHTAKKQHTPTQANRNKTSKINQDGDANLS